MTDADLRDPMRLRTGTDPTGEPEVDQLVDGIEATRVEMTMTVEEIGDRLDPKNIVADAKETVRAATVGRMEEMANTAGEMVGDAGDSVREAGTGILDTISRNPVPAAMIGIGLGWLAFSSRSSGSDGRRMSHRRRGQWVDEPSHWADEQSRWANEPSSARVGYGDRGPGMVDRAGRAVGDATDQLGSTVGSAADRVGTTVGHAADQVGGMAGQVPDQVGYAARQLGDNASRLFDQYPLVVGAAAVAVGATIGLALPPTEMERRTIGQPAREVLGKAEETASQALGQAQASAHDAELSARESETGEMESRSRPH